MISWARIALFIAFGGNGIFIFHTFASSQQAPNDSLISEATSAPAISYYDYIIIGGGTAGCPLAATLSQNATVLLLERGGSPYGDPNITYLSNYGRALTDLSPSSSPAQRFTSEDGVVNARARVLGGGSSINSGFYSRAEDQFVAAAGWDRVLVEESYRWVEEVVAFEPTVRQWQSAVRDGLLEAGVVPYNGFTYEHLIGTKVGGTIFDGEERRHSAADLILKYANPTRLTVLLHASAHKILFTTKGKKGVSAEGVVFRDACEKEHRAYLKEEGGKNEVILSAGALGSPQLLILSGVGPVEQLKAHNITLVLDEAMVGQGMGDNPANGIYVPSPRQVEVSLIEVVGITPFGSYIEEGSGKNFASGEFNSQIQQQSPIITPNQNDPRDVQGGFLFEKVKGPLSRGYLRIKSKNPNDTPSVRFNYFNNTKDLERCVYGLRVIADVVETEAFAPFRFENYSLPFLPDNVTSLEQYCLTTVRTLWHYHGGCQVGRVVDSDYRVIGVDALRVVDGSTFNASPGTNPQATLMMLGRYMGVKILTERFESLRRNSSQVEMVNESSCVFYSFCQYIISVFKRRVS